jgi:hypothetical protein
MRADKAHANDIEPTKDAPIAGWVTRKGKDVREAMANVDNMLASTSALERGLGIIGTKINHLNGIVERGWNGARRLDDRDKTLYRESVKKLEQAESELRERAKAAKERAVAKAATNTIAQYVDPTAKPAPDEKDPMTKPPFPPKKKRPVSEDGGEPRPADTIDRFANDDGGEAVAEANTEQAKPEQPGAAEGAEDPEQEQLQGQFAAAVSAPPQGEPTDGVPPVPTELAAQPGDGSVPSIGPAESLQAPPGAAGAPPLSPGDPAGGIMPAPTPSTMATPESTDKLNRLQQNLLDLGIKPLSGGSAMPGATDQMPPGPSGEVQPTDRAGGGEQPPTDPDGQPLGVAPAPDALAGGAAPAAGQPKFADQPDGDEPTEPATLGPDGKPVEQAVPPAQPAGGTVQASQDGQSVEQSDQPPAESADGSTGEVAGDVAPSVDEPPAADDAPTSDETEPPTDDGEPGKKPFPFKKKPVTKDAADIEQFVGKDRDFDPAAHPRAENGKFTDVAVPIESVDALYSVARRYGLTPTVDDVKLFAMGNVKYLVPVNERDVLIFRPPVKPGIGAQLDADDRQYNAVLQKLPSLPTKDGPVFLTATGRAHFNGTRLRTMLGVTYDKLLPGAPPPQSIWKSVEMAESFTALTVKQPFRKSREVLAKVLVESNAWVIVTHCDTDGVVTGPEETIASRHIVARKAMPVRWSDVTPEPMPIQLKRYAGTSEDPPAQGTPHDSLGRFPEEPTLKELRTPDRSFYEQGASHAFCEKYLANTVRRADKRPQDVP